MEEVYCSKPKDAIIQVRFVGPSSTPSPTNGRGVYGSDKCLQ